jgi:hypothetical protein
MGIFFRIMCKKTMIVGVFVIKILNFKVFASKLSKIQVEVYSREKNHLI